MSEEKQTVVDEPNTDAKPSAEGSDAQEDKSLDELLAEFDGESEQEEKPKQKSQEEKPKSNGELTPEQKKALLEDLRTEMKVEEEINSIVSDIKGDLPVEDEYVRWKLESMASKDERVWKAFLARNKNPKAWGAIIKDIKSNLQKTYGKPASTDKERISAAVHSANTTTGTSKEVDVKKMSDVDFEMNKEKLLKEAMRG